MHFALQSLNREQVQIRTLCFKLPVSSILSVYCLSLNLCLPEGLLVNLFVPVPISVPVCPCVCHVWLYVCVLISVCHVWLCLCLRMSVLCDCVFHVFCASVPHAWLCIYWTAQRTPCGLGTGPFMEVLNGFTRHQVTKTPTDSDNRHYCKHTAIYQLLSINCCVQPLC